MYHCFFPFPVIPFPSTYFFPSPSLLSLPSLLSPSLPLHFSVFLNALVSFKSVSESITFPGGKATFGSWLQEEVSAAAHNPLGLMSRQTSQQGGWGRESWSPRMEKANWKRQEWGQGTALEDTPQWPYFVHWIPALKTSATTQELHGFLTTEHWGTHANYKTKLLSRW